MSFNQSSYQTDEGSSFAAAVVASICYEGSFDVEIRTMDLTATGEGRAAFGSHSNVVDPVTRCSVFIHANSFTNPPLELQLMHTYVRNMHTEACHHCKFYLRTL